MFLNILSFFSGNLTRDIPFFCDNPLDDVFYFIFQNYVYLFLSDIPVRFFRSDESNDLVEGGQLRQTIKAVLNTGHTMDTGYWAGAGNCENL